jgi:DNA-binding response OmpR family regulator
LLSSDHEDADPAHPKPRHRRCGASGFGVVQRSGSPEPVVIQIANLKIDPERRLFWRGEEEIHLSPKEFDLLALMMKHSGVTLSHVKLLRSVWGLEYRFRNPEDRNPRRRQRRDGDA